MAVSVDCGKVGRRGGGDLVEEEDWDKDESMDWDHVMVVYFEIGYFTFVDGCW